MSLAPIVDLYRACGRPALQGADFEFEVDFAEGAELIEQVRRDSDAVFRDLVVDDVDLEEGDQLPKSGARIQFCLRLPTNSSSRFHQNISELVESDPDISCGTFPRDYYLIEEDYYSESDPPPKSVGALKSVCTLINGMASLAHYRDSGFHGCLKLVFIQPDSDMASNPAVVETKVSPEVVANAVSCDFHLVEELATTTASNDPHYTARVGVFATSIAHFIGDRPRGSQEFAYLVEHWSEFVAAYQRDLSTYISGFAFHKAKREVSQAEFDLASQLSGVITGIAGKILSVPLSMVAVVAMINTRGVLDQILIWLGIGVASLLLAGAVWNQRSQLKRIGHAKTITLGAIEGRKDQYPPELQVEIANMVEGLDADECRLWRWLRVYYWASFLPIAAASIALIWMHWQDLVGLMSVLADLLVR